MKILLSFSNDYQNGDQGGTNQGVIGHDSLTNKILLRQQLVEFGNVYSHYMTLKRKEVENYKKFNKDESIKSLLKSSNVVDDFLSDMMSSYYPTPS